MRLDAKRVKIILALGPYLFLCRRVDRLNDPDIAAFLKLYFLDLVFSCFLIRQLCRYRRRVAAADLTVYLYLRRNIFSYRLQIDLKILKLVLGQTFDRRPKISEIKSVSKFLRSEIVVKNAYGVGGRVWCDRYRRPFRYGLGLGSGAALFAGADALTETAVVSATEPEQPVKPMLAIEKTSRVAKIY